MFCLIGSLQLLMIKIDNIYLLAIAGKRYNWQTLTIMSFSTFVILDSEIGWKTLEVFAIKNFQIIGVVRGFVIK